MLVRSKEESEVEEQRLQHSAALLRQQIQGVAHHMQARTPLPPLPLPPLSSSSSSSSSSYDDIPTTSHCKSAAVHKPADKPADVLLLRMEEEEAEGAITLTTLLLLLLLLLITID
jgi:hypothetical protein